MVAGLLLSGTTVVSASKSAERPAETIYCTITVEGISYSVPMNIGPGTNPEEEMKKCKKKLDEFKNAIVGINP